MDLSRGCIFLARSLDESDIFQNEKWLKVWLWCLIKANHKDKTVPVKTGRGETVVSLKRGQFIFGRHVAARNLRMPPSTVRNIMLKLKNMRNLDIKEDTHFSIVTILDYDVYQNIESYKGQAKGQPKDNQRTTKGQPKDTNNNVKNVKNEKNTTTLKPDSVTEQTWKDFLAHRKNKKAIVTQGVIDGFQKQANLAGYTLEEAFKESINRGWSGFKADWVNKDKPKSKKSIEELRKEANVKYGYGFDNQQNGGTDNQKSEGGSKPGNDSNLDNGLKRLSGSDRNSSN